MRFLTLSFCFLLSHTLIAAQIPELGVQVGIIDGKGLEVISIQKGQWAAQGGIQLGDVITKYKLLPNRSFSSLNQDTQRHAKLLIAQLRAIHMSQKNSATKLHPISLQVQSGNREFLVKGDLINGPQAKPQQKPAANQQRPRLGIIVVSAAIEDGGGAVVLEVLPGSTGESIGLKAGHIIRVFECGENYVEVKTKRELGKAIIDAPFGKEFFIDAVDSRGNKLELRGTFERPKPPIVEQAPAAKEPPKKPAANETPVSEQGQHTAQVTSFRAGTPNVIMINAGSNAGLSKGQLIYIKRGNAFLCQARLVKVAGDKSMAHNQNNDWDESITVRELKPGDGVDLEP